MLLVFPEVFVHGAQGTSQQQIPLLEGLCQNKVWKKIVLISYKKLTDISKYIINIVKKYNYTWCRAKIV